MAGGNELAQLMNMMKKLQTTQDESESRITFVATTLQTLIREMSTKVANTRKGNYQNRNKKDSGCTSKEVHALERFTKYTTIGTMYTQALERLLSEGMINLPPTKPETQSA